MPYKLTVVKTSTEEYLINFYHKIPDERVPDFASAINRIFDYTQIPLIMPEVFESQPTFVDLSENEEKAIRNIRDIVLKEFTIGRCPKG